MIKSIFKKDENNEGKKLAQEVFDLFGGADDIVRRRISIGAQTGLLAEVIFIDGVVASAEVAEFVLQPLTDPVRFGSAEDIKDAKKRMLEGVVFAHAAKDRDNAEDIAQDLLNGYCAVIFEDSAVTFEVRSTARRTVSEPKEEKVVKGAKDAFTETLKINATLVRRRLADKRLMIKNFVVGEKSNTTVAIVYIEGFTNKELVKKVTERLKDIKCQGMLTAARLEENIVDNPKSPFPQLIQTERSDKFCINLLEGRVGILVDGLPMGFLAPGTFTQFMKVPEDLSEHFLVASVLTMLRYTALVLTLVLPAFYVAVAMYHQEMLPSKLIQSIIDAKQAVPFPTAFEVVAMLLAFELLQEAGLRLPNPVGQTVSIVGALIVGQSAVEAKVVSPVVVVVIALAGIAGYSMPNQDMGAALRVCRFILVIFAVLFGMFGLAIGSALIIYHLAGLESFGVPYMTPFAGNEGKHVLRALIRTNMKRQEDREPALKPEGK